MAAISIYGAAAMTDFTAEQVLQLAPDDASVKAARGLVRPDKWPLLAYDGRAVWGHCQGSGSKPYQCAVDKNGPAFRCSCPSRKIPCKHVLALLLMYADRQDAFSAAEQPDWLAQWLDKRENAQTAKSSRKEVPDAAARQKRLQTRLNKAAAGMADLQLWLNDIVRNGLLAFRSTQHERCSEMARRMVDAQMPGLANELNRLAVLPSERQQELWQRLAKLHLFTQVFPHADRLPENQQAEIYWRIGIPPAKEDVLGGTPVCDVWLNIGCISEILDKGESRSHWLYGLGTQRFAYLLEFVFKGSSQDGIRILRGAAYAGSLCFYPGVANYRALNVPDEWEHLSEYPSLPSFTQTFAASWQPAAQARQQNPFLTHVPLRLDNARLYEHDGQTAFGDGEMLTPLDTLNYSNRLKLLTAVGGEAFTAFVLYDGSRHSSRLLAVIGKDGSLNVLTE